MSEDYRERRHDANDLRYAVDSLKDTVGDLKLTVGELKITVGTMKERDSEDRVNAKELARDVGVLKEWRSRIRGQIALAYALILLVGASVAARILKLIP